MAQELVTVFDDGVTRVVHLVQDGVLVCESVEMSPDNPDAKQAEAERQAVERHRDVLRQQLDPKRADPSQKEVTDAQAFIALAADIGITQTLAVADETIIVAEVDVPSRG